MGKKFKSITTKTSNTPALSLYGHIVSFLKVITLLSRSQPGASLSCQTSNPSIDSMCSVILGVSGRLTKTQGRKQLEWWGKADHLSFRKGKTWETKPSGQGSDDTRNWVQLYRPNCSAQKSSWSSLHIKALSLSHTCTKTWRSWMDSGCWFPQRKRERSKQGCVQQPGDPGFGRTVYWKIHITEPKKPRDLNSQIRAKTKNLSKPSIKP